VALCGFGCIPTRTVGCSDRPHLLGLGRLGLDPPSEFLERPVDVLLSEVRLRLNL